MRARNLGPSVFFLDGKQEANQARWHASSLQLQLSKPPGLRDRVTDVIVDQHFDIVDI
jgi:hypothetical protein